MPNVISAIKKMKHFERFRTEDSNSLIFDFRYDFLCSATLLNLIFPPLGEYLMAVEKRFSAIKTRRQLLIYL
jgi:hypothetical protein